MDLVSYLALVSFGLRLFWAWALLRLWSFTLIRTRFFKSETCKMYTFLGFITTQGNKHRRRNHGLHWMFSLTSNEFRRAFRMFKKSFYVLLKLVHDDLIKDHSKAKNSSGSPITPLIKKYEICNQEKMHCRIAQCYCINWIWNNNT